LLNFLLIIIIFIETPNNNYYFFLQIPLQNNNISGCTFSKVQIFFQ
jgi:hypothetical protein